MCSLSPLIEGRLNDTYRLLFYSDDMLIQAVCTLKRNTEALVAASKEICLELNADKTKYIAMSQDQNARQNHNVRMGNKLFEMLEQFKYLGTSLTS